MIALKKNWLVIASQVKARIYQFDKSGKLKLIDEFSNPRGREKNKAFTTDKPGMNRAKMKNSSPHSMTGEKNPHVEVRKKFSKLLSDYIHKQFLRKSFDQINIVADAKLIGEIRHLAKKFLKDKAEWTVKDLEKIPQNEWYKILKIPKTRRILRTV